MKRYQTRRLLLFKIMEDCPELPARSAIYTVCLSTVLPVEGKWLTVKKEIQTL